MSLSRRRGVSPAGPLALVLALVLLPSLGLAARAPKSKTATPKTDGAPPESPAGAKDADAKPHATTARHALGGPASGAGAVASHLGTIAGLPHYEEPGEYSVDLVIHTTEAENMVMHRFVDNGRMRTDIDAEGQALSMIELGDDKGTTYTLMPGEKKAIKQSRQAMEGLMAKAGAKEKAGADAQRPETPEAKVEDLGDETIDGRVVKKLRMSVADGSAIGWFDKATGAPVRMESKAEGKTASIEWKNMKPGPQPDAMFTIPKGYEVTDMDEMMAKMKTMGGMPGMGGGAMLGGLAGAGGMGGMGMGGGLKGMAGGVGQNFGSQMGGSLGGTLGASLGGPLGAMAGQYLGGKIGGMIGKKAAETVMPGK